MPYGRRERVSRALDESEFMIDDRISRHVASAMPADVYAGVPISMGYEWMKEDLALRSAKADQLAQEQRLAYAASERKALADQVDRQNRDDDETVSALKEMNAMVQSGKAANAADARARMLAKNPEFAMNKRFMEASAAYGASEFDREEYKREKTRKETADLEVQLKRKNVQGLLNAANENPEMFDNVIKHRMELEALQAENGLADEKYSKDFRKETEELISLKRAAEIEKARTESRIAKGEIPNPDDLDALVEIQGGLDAAGLGAVEDIPAMMTRFGKSKYITGMLADREWMGGLTDAEKEAVTNDLNNPNGGAELRRIAGRWANEHKNELGMLQLRDEQLNAAGDVAKVVSGFAKAVEGVEVIEDVLSAAEAAIAPMSGVPGFDRISSGLRDAIKNEVAKEVEVWRKDNDNEYPEEKDRAPMYRRAAAKVIGYELPKLYQRPDAPAGPAAPQSPVDIPTMKAGDHAAWDALPSGAKFRKPGNDKIFIKP